jgi:hypothetical protein
MADNTAVVYPTYTGVHSPILYNISAIPRRNSVPISVHCTNTIHHHCLIQQFSEWRLLGWTSPSSSSPVALITGATLHWTSPCARSPRRLSKHINWPALVARFQVFISSAVSLHSVIGQLGPGCSVSDLEIQRNGPGWLLFGVSKSSTSRFSISRSIGVSSNKSTATKSRSSSTGAFVRLPSTTIISDFSLVLSLR